MWYKFLMARTITRAELRTRLEVLTDTENDAHIGTTEKNEAINSALAETWDLIISSGLSEKGVKSVAFNTVANQLEYPIATYVTAGDFYKISQLYVNEGNGRLRPLERINPAEIECMVAPTTAQAMKLYYIPYSPEWGSGDDALYFDGINGWEEHTLMVAACAIKLKKDDSWAQYNQRKEELAARIRAMGNTDFSGPVRVVRRYKRQQDPFNMVNSTIRAYGLRGANIELYSHSGYLV